MMWLVREMETSACLSEKEGKSEISRKSTRQLTPSRLFFRRKGGGGGGGGYRTTFLGKEETVHLQSVGLSAMALTLTRICPSDG